MFLLKVSGKTNLCRLMKDHSFVSTGTVIFLRLIVAGCGSTNSNGSSADERGDLSTAARTTQLALTDPDCPNGGILVESGIDENRNGLLDDEEQETDQVFELYTVTATGAHLEKMSGTLVANGSVGSFSWAPDGTRLAYLADQNIDSEFKLFTVRPDGSGNTKVNGTLVSGGTVSSFKWLPTSNQLAYTADQENDNVFELYTVAPDGSNNVKVSGERVDNGDVVSFEW